MVEIKEKETWCKKYGIHLICRVKSMTGFIYTCYKPEGAKDWIFFSDYPELDQAKRRCQSEAKIKEK